MDAIKSQLGVADHVQPVELLGYAQPAFIAVIERSLRKQFHQPLLERGQVLLDALVGRGDRGFAEGLPVEVGTNLG